VAAFGVNPNAGVLAAFRVHNARVQAAFSVYPMQGCRQRFFFRVHNALNAGVEALFREHNALNAGTKAAFRVHNAEV
jgi:hypothetical protein